MQMKSEKITQRAGYIQELKQWALINNADSYVKECPNSKFIDENIDLHVLVW